LLADKSIKPGDVISVGDYFGWVGSMGTRYTSLDLKDGRELLVPNEDLVTQRVINWSYSSDLMRLEVKFNTTYDSDLHKTRAAAVKAAQSGSRTQRPVRPACAAPS
jgi:small-conductance mechanosensitive channel